MHYVMSFKVLCQPHPLQGDDEKEFMAKQTGGKVKEQTDSSKPSKNNSSLAPKVEDTPTRALSPKHDPAERRPSGQASLGVGSPTPCECSGVHGRGMVVLYFTS